MSWACTLVQLTWEALLHIRSSAALATLFLVLSPVAHADLIGDTIHVTQRAPDASSVANDLGIVSAPGTTALYNYIDIAVAGSSVTFATTGYYTSITFDPIPFAGFALEDLTKNPGVTGFAIEGNPLGGFTADEAAIAGNTLLFNLAGHQLYYGSPLTFDFLSASAPGTPVSAAPEPSSFALIGSGMLGVAGILRKRFA